MCGYFKMLENWFTPVISVRWFHQPFQVLKKKDIKEVFE